METKDKNKDKKQEEIMSRRKFFRRAAGMVAPAIALAVLPQLLTSCEIDEPYSGEFGVNGNGGGSSTGCDTCKGTCVGGCYQNCTTSCGRSNCTGTCIGGCDYSCEGECKRTCGSACSTSCVSLSRRY